MIESYRPKDTQVLHITRAPFFVNANGNPHPEHEKPTIQVGKGGVEIAVALGAKHLNDAAITLSSNGSNGTKWTENTFDKRGIPELGIPDAPYPITHTIFEQGIPKEAYDGFRNWSIAMWWIHHGLGQELAVDVEDIGLNKDFISPHTAHRKVSASVARHIKELPLSNKVVIVQDPYYHPRVATTLERLGKDNSKVVGVNHIPFPEPKDFELMKQITPQHWDKLAKAYLNGWLSFDAISFHTQEDADNFRASVQRFCNEDKQLPELIVNPLGIDIKMTEQIADATSEEDRKKLLDLVLANAKTLRGIDDLDGLIIGASIGYRSDPIKQIPLNLQAINSLLRMHPDLHGKVTYVQQIRPHRVDDFESYRREYAKIKQTAESINIQHASEGWQPVILIDQALQNKDVIKLQRVLADLASRFFTSIPSIEGMNLAGQETFVASSRSDVGLITTTGSGLGRTLARNNAGEFVMPKKRPTPEEIGSRIASFLSMPLPEVEQINQKVKNILESIDSSHWLNRLMYPSDQNNNSERTH